MNYKRGKDLSRHQGAVDMARLAQSTDELLMRCAMGGNGIDDRFAEYWADSAPYPWVRAPYFLPIVDIPWRSQRENILRRTRGDWGNGRLTFDYEMRSLDVTAIRNGWRWPKEKFTSDMFELYQSLKTEGIPGFRAYGNQGSIDGMFTRDRDWLLEMELHVAAYPWRWATVTYEMLHDLLHAGSYNISVPYPWSTLPPGQQIAAWQGASTGRYDGVAGDVDLSLILVSAPPPPPVAESGALRAYQHRLVAEMLGQL